ncbi:MAG: hypothetical protein M3Y56_15000, partial [Armatimonadota bacterium]|nr:hypothetical protein [Armatimonadota bacterium]
MQPPLKRRSLFGGTLTAITFIGAGIGMNSPLAMADSSQPAPVNPGQIVRPGGTNLPTVDSSVLKFTISTPEKVYNQGETIALNLNLNNVS